ncbi:MAG: hypothetical protein ACREDR_08135 [Blastocatellia bacterium]
MIAKLRRWTLGFLLLSQTACLQWMVPHRAEESATVTPACPQVKTIPAEELPPATLEHFGPDAEVDAIPRYEAEIRAKVMSGRFDELEKTAANLRTTKERFAGGAWRLERFYTGAGLPLNDNKAPDSEWKPQLDKLETWVEERPDSLTAHIALGRALLEYGWRARGEGYADTVTEDGNRLFSQRVTDASRVLASVGASKNADPAWYSVMLEIGISQGWNRAEFEKVFEEGVSVAPLYHYLYFDKARYLMPRWYGRLGDDERFMDESRRRLGGKEGSAMYYLIGEYLFPYYGFRTFITDSKVCWEIMKEGYFAMESLHSPNVSHMNYMAKMCALAREKPMCKWLFIRLGDQWDPAPWPKGKPDFEEYKSWALS